MLVRNFSGTYRTDESYEVYPEQLERCEV
jgi:hypothetical protein